MSKWALIAIGQSNRQGSANAFSGPRIPANRQFHVSHRTGQTDPYPGCNNVGQGGSAFPFLQDLMAARGVHLDVFNYAIGGASVVHYTGRQGGAVTGGSASLPASQGYMSPVGLSGSGEPLVEGQVGFDPFGLLARTRTKIQEVSGLYDRVIVVWGQGESDSSMSYQWWAAGVESVLRYVFASGLVDEVHLDVMMKWAGVTDQRMVEFQASVEFLVSKFRGEGKPVHPGADLYAKWGSAAPLYPDDATGTAVHLTLRGQEHYAHLTAAAHDAAMKYTTEGYDPVTVVAAYFGGWKDPPEAGVTWYQPSPWGYVPSNDITMGDYPERHPVYGAIDEDQQWVIEHHLQLAQQGGVGVFAVNWYRDDYLNYAAVRMAAAPMSIAPNVKWCLQWSNHYSVGATYAHEKPWVYEGVRRAAMRMRGDRYWMKNGKPVFIIFSTGHIDQMIVQASGTPSSVTRNPIINDFQNIIGNVLDGDTTGGISGSTVTPSSNPGAYLVVMTNDTAWANVSRIDAFTNYNVRGATYGGGHTLAHSYDEITWACGVAWRSKKAMVGSSGKKAWPCITTGWDSRPWGGTVSDPLADNCQPTIEQFRSHLRSARAFAQHPSADKTVFLFAWNEFGEGGWVQPTPAIGTTRLDALRLMTDPLLPQQIGPRFSARLALLMDKFATGAFRGFALDRTATYTTQDWDALQATGANVVRAPIWMYRAPTGVSYLAPDLTWHLDVLNQCASRGIGVILVLVPFPAVGTSSQDVEYWDTPELRPFLASRWVEIVNVVKDYPALVGYDIINEPVGGAAIPGDTAGTPLKKALWLSISQPICDAIRAADPYTPILWEPYQWGLPGQFWLSEAPTIPGLVLSCHWYEPATYTHQGINGYPAPVPLPVSDYTEKLLEARKIATRRGLPMFIGEFGALRWAPDRETWLARSIALFKAEKWGWAVHVWRPVWEGWDTEIPIGAANGGSPGTRSPTSPALLAVKAGILAP